MSLKSMLSGKSEEDRQFQSIVKSIITPKPSFTTLSGKKAFSDEYKELAPYSLSKKHYAALVGMGFDYLARFIIAKNLDNSSNKKFAYSNLVAGRGIIRLEGIIEKRLYKAINQKYEKGLDACARFVNGKENNFDEILYFAAYLAYLESVARSGMPPQDIKKSLIDDADIEIINDLRSLCNIFENRFSNCGILKGNNDIIYNPKFGFVSMYCGGADADIFIDGTLYDFKCTKDRGYKSIECAQIIGYYLLHVIDIKCGGNGIGTDEFGSPVNINKLAFYRSRYGEIETIDVMSLDRNKVKQAIKDLGKLWGLSFAKNA